MTMDGMNAYLEDRGFEVKREYIRHKQEYKFTISKDGITKSYYWAYPKTNLYLTKNQVTAMENMIDDFHKKTSFSQLKELERRCNSLFGSLETGYSYEPKVNIYHKEVQSLADYLIADVKMTKDLIKRRINMVYGAPVEIKDVIFNNPATVVFWTDGTKTIVKAVNEDFDKEKGLAMAVAKKFFGNKGNYYNNMKKWLKDD